MALPIKSSSKTDRLGTLAYGYQALIITRSWKRDRNMRIASIIDISLVDVPKIPVTVIFTAGCNFDCSYCQNAELIPLSSGESMTIPDIVNHARGHFVDGYCITGGEPTIHKDLPELLKALKEDCDCHINLNTQGSVPSVLERSLPYINSVWFDMKASPTRYIGTVRTSHDPWPKVQRSLELLIDSDVLFWPRTTYVGNLTTPDDIRGILVTLQELGFRGEYVVQNYIDSTGTREAEVAAFEKPNREELESLRSNLPSGITMRLEWR